MTLGLRARAVLAFGVTFMVFVVAAATTNVVLLRRTIDAQRQGPTPEALNEALEAVAAETDQPVPDVIMEPNGFAIGPVVGEGALASPQLDSGTTVLDASEAWLIARVGEQLVNDVLAEEIIDLPSDAAGIDQILFLRPLANLESHRPGLTDEFLHWFESLTLADGSPVVAGPIRGDGDLCRAALQDCDEFLAMLQAVTLLEADAEAIATLEAALERALDEARDEALQAQLRISAAVALGSTVLAGAAAWFVAGRILGPVRRVTAVARAASIDSLDHRIDHNGPDDELKELADTFDAMLERLDGSFAAQRRFGSNAAHELKTPLAVMRAEIDATRADTDAGQRELALLERLDGAARRSERVVESLLDLARAEATAAAPRPVDLGDLVGGAVVDQAGALSRRGLEVNLEISPSVSSTIIQGDAAQLEILVANLIDNVTKYATEHTTVPVTIDSSTRGLRLTVANEGPPLSDGADQWLLEPFRRGTERTSAPATNGNRAVGSDTEGSGLGLSIVAAVAAAHDAPVTLDTPIAGGLAVSIDFPTTGT